jgi:hypothetical protein
LDNQVDVEYTLDIEVYNSEKDLDWGNKLEVMKNVWDLKNF